MNDLGSKRQLLVIFYAISMSVYQKSISVLFSFIKL